MLLFSCLYLLGEVALRSNDGEVLVMMERMCIAV